MKKYHKRITVKKAISHGDDSTLAITFMLEDPCSVTFFRKLMDRFNEGSLEKDLSKLLNTSFYSDRPESE